MIRIPEPESELVNQIFIANATRLINEKNGIVKPNIPDFLIDLFRDSKEILEIGSSLGVYTIRLGMNFQNANIVGLDIDKNSIHYAKKLAINNNVTNVSYVNMSLENFCNIELNHEKYGAIFTKDSLHHFNDLDLFFKMISSLQPKNGKIFIQDLFVDKQEYMIKETIKERIEIGTENFINKYYNYLPKRNNLPSILSAHSAYDKKEIIDSIKKSYRIKDISTGIDRIMLTAERI